MLPVAGRGLAEGQLWSHARIHNGGQLIIDSFSMFRKKGSRLHLIGYQFILSFSDLDGVNITYLQIPEAGEPLPAYNEPLIFHCGRLRPVGHILKIVFRHRVVFPSFEIYL
jgi:hypothetical protein